MPTHYLMVGLGGALGAMLRVFFSKLLPAHIMGLPTYILLVNIIGCFLIGLLVEALPAIWPGSDNMRYFLVSGLLGGFTTFSAFALEFGFLVERNQMLLAMLYAALSVALCLFAFFVGLKCYKLIG